MSAVTSSSSPAPITQDQGAHVPKRKAYSTSAAKMGPVQALEAPPEFSLDDEPSASTTSAAIKKIRSVSVSGRTEEDDLALRMAAMKAKPSSIFNT